MKRYVCMTLALLCISGPCRAQKPFHPDSSRLFELPFTLYRYRKDRLAAIKHRYRQSKWIKIIPPRLVAHGSFILLILEIVVARLLGAR